MDVLQVLRLALEEKKDTRLLKLQVVLESHSRKKYVIGKNEQARQIIDTYHVDGLIDDFGESGERWHGVPVIKIKDIDPSGLVINCVSSISPVQVARRLSESGVQNVVALSDLLSSDSCLIPLPWFVAQQREEMNDHTDWWIELYHQLADDESRKVMIDVTRYKLTADLNYMADYAVRLNDQYFEDFMGYERECFVDAGGYDGDTAEEFIKRYPDYQKIYLIEPSKVNMDAAKKRLHGHRDIIFFSVGLSNEAGELTFDTHAGSASGVMPDGGNGESIAVVTLDDKLRHEPVTCIKMDLEGWELMALKGAAGIIAKQRPKLAIAVYHAAKDMREISQFIHSIHPDYHHYLRHYTQGWSETVLFFV